MAHLNQIENARYQFNECLDRTYRQTPQPETLYIDPQTGNRLVIERKSISWPPDYPRLHSNDHLLAGSISNELRDLNVEDVYVLRLPPLIEGTRNELVAFGKAIAQRIRHAYPLREGQVIGTNKAGRHWSFCLQPLEDREDDHPKKGIIYIWEQRFFPVSHIDPYELPVGFENTLKQLYTSCVRKFAQYSGARRILVLDPHGKLRYNSANWWNDVFTVSPPPLEAQEIWSGIFDWVDDWERGWICEPLWGKHFERAPELKIEFEGH